MDKPLTADDKFLASMKKKHETKEVDKPKVEKQTMQGILKDIVQVPAMLHMTGTPETASAKKAKPQEMKGTKGSDEFKSTMNTEY